MKRTFAILLFALPAFPQATYTPGQATGCLWWLRGDDIAATMVATATGCGGTTATPSAVAPIKATNEVAGHAAIEGNGTTESYTVNTTTLIRSMFVLGMNYRDSSTSTAGCFAGQNSSGFNGAPNYMCPADGSGVNKMGSVWKDSSGTTQLNVGGVYAQQNSTYGLYSFIVTGTSPYTLTVKVNGQSVGAATASFTLPSIANTAGMGDYFAHAVLNWCKCRVIDIMASSSALSSDEEARVRNYYERTYFLGFGPGAMCYAPGFDSAYIQFSEMQYSADCTVASPTWTRITFGQANVGTSNAHTERDESTIYQDGYWWTFHTNSLTSGNCNVATSLCFGVDQSITPMNGMKSHAQNVQAGNSNTGTPAAWAPEAFLDGAAGVHVFYAYATSAGAHAIWETHPTTGHIIDNSWANATAITVVDADSPTELIDPFLWYDCTITAGTCYWYMTIVATASGAHVNLYRCGGGDGCSETQPIGTYNRFKKDLFSTHYYEGQSVRRIAGGNWRWFIDDGGAGYYYSDCQPDMSSCGTITSLGLAAVTYPNFPNTGYDRHFTMMLNPLGAVAPPQ